MPSTRRRTAALLLVCVAIVLGIGSHAAGATALASPSGTMDTDDGTDVNVTVKRAPGDLPPGEAIVAAEANASIRSDDWLVLTVDVGDVLDDVDRSTRLDAVTGGTQNVTLGIRQTNPSPERPAHRIHPRNLTRFVDAENGTITYVYDGEAPGLNPYDPVYRVNLTVAAANPNVRSRRQVTREFELRPPELHIGPDDFSNYNDVGDDVLLPESNVSVPIEGNFAAGKPLDVAVRELDSGRTVDRQSLTIPADGTTNVSLNLSTVSVGSRVALTVRDGHTDRLIGYQRAAVDRRPVVELRRVYQTVGLPRSGTGTVLVEVANVGTATFDGQVSASFRERAFATEATVPPGAVRNVSLQVRTNNSSVGHHELRLVAGEYVTREEVFVGTPILDGIDLEKYETTDDETVVRRGTNLTVELRLYNPATRPTDANVVLRAGNYSTTRTIRLDPRTLNETHVTVPTDQFAPGDHEISVRAGNDTGTLHLDVQPAVETPTASRTATTGADGAGFTALGSLLALLSLVALARRRSDAG